jgi:hypothetical protein
MSFNSKSGTYFLKNSGAEEGICRKKKQKTKIDKKV